MKKYSNVMNTNVTWIPQIPAHWKLQKINALFTERKKKVSDKDYKPLSVTKKGILPQLEHAAKSNDSDNRKLVKKGDFVINSRSDRKGSCGVSRLDGSVSLINIVLTPSNELNSKYIHYLLRNYRFSEEYYRNGRGIVADLWTTRYSEMRTILLPVPPRAEQDQIVRFLDWKVSEINKLIGIRRKEIKELEKLCWIVIVNAISKVKQKNISEWKRVRVKQICRMQSGTNLISQVIGQSGNYPVYGGNGLRGYYKNYTNDGQYVIIGRQGALAGNVHLVEGRFWATDHAIVVYCSKFLIPRYAYYLFTGMNLNQYAFNAAAQPGLSVTKILNLQCDVPSVARQLEIADRLDEICIQLEKIVNNTKKKIKLLQELKSVIISDVVTGKIDVRNIPVPAYEHVDDLTADDGEGNDGETGIPGEED